jgi:hypothetical protein
MKKLMLLKTFLFLASLLYSAKSEAQLNKGTWIVGGVGSYSSTRNIYSYGSIYLDTKVTEINISPNIGYFIFDKFNAGLKPTFTKYKAHETSAGGGGRTDETRLEIGPFARYYFLNKEKVFNLLTEASYQFGVADFRKEKGNNSTLSLMAGPVLYFNSSVGLEFLFGYYKRHEKLEASAETEEKGFRISIGFQFHLERE